MGLPLGTAAPLTVNALRVSESSAPERQSKGLASATL